MNARTVQELFTKAWHHSITLWRTESFYFEPLCIALGLLHGAFVIYLMCWKSNGRAQTRSDSYQALLSVFVPTSSAWPSKHAALLNSLAFSCPPKVMNLSASAIFKNVVDGIIEAKNPQDLSHILRSRLRIYGWTIQFSLDFRWRVSFLVWIMGSLFFRQSAKIQDEDCSTSSTTNSIVFPDILFPTTGSITSSFKTHLLTSAYANSLLCLDFVAYNDVERALYSFQFRLKNGLAGTIHFTSMTSNFPLYSDSFMFCCLPFAHRKYLGRHVVQRTSTPLLLNLHFVTKALSLTTSAASISSVTNVTSEYITVLRFWRYRIVTDKALRTGLVENWGEKGWREHVFLLDWEIGLLDAGLLTRWSIVVQH